MIKWLFLPLLSLILTSCSPSGSKKEKKKLFRINSMSEPVTLDTRKGIDVFSWTLQFMLFDGLTEITKENTRALGLAEKIDLSEDGKTYTFHLRDAKWSNGDPITSLDIKEHWTSLLHPTFPCPTADLLYPIKNSRLIKEGKLSPDILGLVTPDPKTLVVHLEYPTPHFLELTSFCAFFPIHPSDHDKKIPLLTSGPYRIRKWKKGSEMLLEKNPHYWNASNIKLDQIRISFINNEMTALQMYEKGELDFVGGVLSGIPVDARPSLFKKGTLKTSKMAAVAFCPFNTEKFPFNYSKVRRAFAYAINRQSIIDNITQAKEEVATSFVPSVLKKGRYRTFFQDGNAKEAKKLFREALKELNLTPDYFSRFKLTYKAAQFNHQICQAIQEQWKQVLGVDIQLQAFDFKVYLAAMNQHDFDIAQCGWMAQYTDQTHMLDLFKHKNTPKNYPSWEHPKYIELLTSSLYEKSPLKRLEILEQAEEIFAREMPAACLFHYNNLYLEKDHIKGLFMSPTGLLMVKGISMER